MWQWYVKGFHEVERGSLDIPLSHSYTSKQESITRKCCYPLQMGINPKKDMASRFGTGESMLQTAHRIYGLLDDIKAGDKEYILVAHNGLVRIIESYFREMDNEEFSSIGIKNCEVKRYDFR